MKRYSRIVISSLILAVVLLAIPSTRWYEQHFFFGGGHDCFADFLNNVSSLTLTNGFNPYHSFVIAQREQIYPPFAYVIFEPFTKLMPEKGMTLQQCHHSLGAMAVGFIGTALMASMLLAACVALCKRFGLKVWFAILLCCSGMVLNCCERGNQVLLSAAGVGVFLCYYDAAGKYAVAKRVAAALGLAMAISLKVTPLAFGVLWLNRRDFKWLCLCGGGAFAMTFVPLLWSDHSILENIAQLKSNAFEWQNYYVKNATTVNPLIIPRVLLNRMGCNDATRTIVISMVRWSAFVLGVICVTLSVINRNLAWKRFFLLATSQVFLPLTPQGYVVLYFLPAIFAYFGEADFAEMGKSIHGQPYRAIVDKVAFIVFLVLALPIPLFVLNGKCGNYVMNTLAITVLSLMLAAEGVRQVCKETRFFHRRCRIEV